MLLTNYGSIKYFWGTAKSIPPKVYSFMHKIGSIIYFGETAKAIPPRYIFLHKNRHIIQFALQYK